MKKLALIFISLILTLPILAQRTTDVEGSKDYPMLSRFDGAVIEFYKTTKWDEYHIPCNFEDGYLQWEEPAKLEGQIYRIQYSVSAENNPNYVLKILKTSLARDRFKIVLAQNSGEMGLSPSQFCGAYYGKLKNNKFGFAYDPNGSDQSLIIAKAENKDVYAIYYVSGFSNTTLITQDVIEAETFTQKMIIASVFRGSSVAYDDKLGFGEFYVSTSLKEAKLTTDKIEGYVRHRFCYVPSDHSLLEVVKNYEEAINKKGGKILVSTTGNRETIDNFLKKGHPDHGMTNYEYIQFGRNASYYFSGKFPGDGVEYYVLLVGAKIDAKQVYSLVTIETKAMAKGMVSVNMGEAIDKTGRVAIYGIHFDTGSSNIKSESESSLKLIADYLNSVKEKKFCIVGHTDNVGGIDNNMELSQKRAAAVRSKLVTEYNVSAEQLKAYGVASLNPVATNSTDSGKAKNRRVEIVEQ